MTIKTAEKRNYPFLIKTATAAAFAALLSVLYIHYDIASLVRSSLELIDNPGWTGVIFFIIIYIAAAVFLIPGSILTLGAGFLFGVVRGSIIVSCASTLGATAAFLIGRYFARGWVEKQLEKKESFKSIDNAVTKEGWKIVLLLRLSPLFPFNLLNYSLGLTGLKLKQYILASWIGMMPGTIMYVYFGSLAKSIAQLGVSAKNERSMEEWALYGAGLIATVAATVFITRLAGKSLTKITPEDK